jgi:two-component system, OmpR family, sensor histidine kinase CreC
MSVEMAEVVAAWPLGASLAAAMAVHGLREGRRRTLLNEAVHELRRPLQALALALPAERAAQPATLGSLRLATSALAQLEREINGEERGLVRARLPVRPLLEAALARWSPRAALSGRSLQLRWRAGEAWVFGDRCLLAQALDNLIVNAIEHGGPEVVIAAEVDRGGLRLAVIDAGRGCRPQRQGQRPVGLVARLSGRRRRGHGLAAVRRVASAHGGGFHLRVSALQTRAVLELPLAVPAGAA